MEELFEAAFPVADGSNGLLTTAVKSHLSMSRKVALTYAGQCSTGSVSSDEQDSLENIRRLPRDISES